MKPHPDKFTFDPAFIDPSGGRGHGSYFGSFCIHRVNLPDSSVAARHPEIKTLVGSKSGIAVVDSGTRQVLLPPGSWAEVDFWWFDDKRGFVTHSPPHLDKLSGYPTVRQFLESWALKRDAEESLIAGHGCILANLKTHGMEEQFLGCCAKYGIPAHEIVFLDQEYPATDRLMREMKGKADIAPVALRVSRIESLHSVLITLEQLSTFAQPHAIFFDPVGSEMPTTFWPFDPRSVSRLYELAPTIDFVLCCPSRWGQADQIEPLSARLQESGLKRPIVMTDIDKMPRWNQILDGWRAV